MTEVWVPIIVALISGGALGTLGKVISDWARGKHKEEDDAWKQRDRERRRADQLHEALMRHRTRCHKYHGATFDDMGTFPGSD